MIIVNNVKLSLDTDFDNLLATAKKLSAFKQVRLTSVKLYRKSVDARHKDNVHFCCTLLIEVAGNEAEAVKRIKEARIFSEEAYKFKTVDAVPEKPPVVVGFGPAGIFAAYLLAKAGLRPIVLERGKDVDARTTAVKAFWNGGPLNTETNVQFGEGGAGAFSDGKLTTGIKDPRCRTVLRLFYEFGAQKNIMTDAKPHIGTDVLVDVIKNLRKEIIRLGGDVRFSHKLESISSENGRISSVVVSCSRKKYTILCDQLILATGHSARDTFYMLRDQGITMTRKPFAVGMRIEHSQKDLNRFMYGEFADHPALGPADYKLAVHLSSGRGVYTFCMCPGGVVVNASSEKGRLAVNGMSYSARDGKNANSAVLTEVRPEDLPGDDVLAGVEFQRKLEETAYNLVDGRGVPVQTVGDYLYSNGQESTISPSVKPYPVFTNVAEIFPNFINASIKEGIHLMDGKISGFNGGSVLIAPESRSSSPVRILRDETLNSVALKGLYPCGEGAGYAGGIMSAAVDGMKCAEAIIETLNQP